MLQGDQVAWIALHVLIFLVPLAVSNLTQLGIGNGAPLSYDQFDIIKLVLMRALTLVAVAGWGIQMLLKGGRIRTTKFDWAVLGVLVWVTITTFTSIHWPTALFGKYRRFEGLLSFINYAAMYFLIIQYVDRPSRMRSILRTFFFSGTLVMLYGALQFVGIEPIKYGTLPFEARRSFATYGNPDLLGGFIVLMLPIAIGMALSEENVFWRTVYWVGSLLTAVVTITAFTRSAWIGGTAAVIALLVAIVRERVQLRTEDWSMGGVALAAVGAVTLASMRSASEVMNVAARVKSIFQFGEGSALTRFQIWSAALRAIKARPIFGFGADTFRLVFPQYKPAAYVAAAGYLSVADNVHNYLLQIASALGIPGAIILYGTFLWIVIATIPRAFKAEGSGSRLLYAAVWAAAFGYIVHLMFGLSVTGTTIFLWMCFGLLVAPFATEHEVRQPDFALGVIASVAVAGVIATLFVGNINYLRADRAYLEARMGQPGTQMRVDAALKAVRLNPYNDMYRAEVGLAYVDMASAALGSQQPDAATAQQLGRDYMLKAADSLVETIRFVPTEYDNYVFLANVYNSMVEYFGMPEYAAKAEKTALAGIRVERYGPAIRFEYARALADSGEVDGAIEQLAYAIKLDPNYSNGTLRLADLYAQSGQRAKALELVRAFVKTHPGDSAAAAALSGLEASATAQ